MPNPRARPDEGLRDVQLRMCQSEQGLRNQLRRFKQSLPPGCVLVDVYRIHQGEKSWAQLVRVRCPAPADAEKISKINSVWSITWPPRADLGNWQKAEGTDDEPHAERTE